MTGIFTPAYSVSKRTGSDGGRWPRVYGQNLEQVRVGHSVGKVAAFHIAIVTRDSELLRFGP
jgi:hypothetical protein